MTTPTLDVDGLRAWLMAHIDSICAFVDFEPSEATEADLADILGTYWFRAPDAWNPRGYRFIPIGIDGTGSELAAWLRPGAESPAPIVIFGSEGGRGVLTTSPTRFALALAHGPALDTFEDPARLTADGNWYFDEDEPEMVAEAREAQARYRAATTARFGELPALEALTADVDVRNTEFVAWVDGVPRGD